MNESDLTSLNRIGEKILRLSHKLLSLPQLKQPFVTMSKTFFNPETMLSEMLEPLTHWLVSYRDSRKTDLAIRQKTLRHSDGSADRRTFSGKTTREHTESVFEVDHKPVPQKPKIIDAIPTSPISGRNYAQSAFSTLPPAHETISQTSITARKEPGDKTESPGIHPSHKAYFQEPFEQTHALSKHQIIQSAQKSPLTGNSESESTAPPIIVSKQLDVQREQPAHKGNNNQAKGRDEPGKIQPVMPDSRQLSHSEPVRVLPATGIRMIHSAPDIAAVLKANIADARGVHGNAVLQKQPEPENQMPPDPFVHADSYLYRPLSESSEKLDGIIDQLLDKLSDRLEFELMRIYGSSGE